VDAPIFCCHIRTNIPLGLCPIYAVNVQKKARISLAIVKHLQLPYPTVHFLYGIDLKGTVVTANILNTFQNILSGQYY